ncbi:hypothetical protein JCM11641_003287 [Rhodosporidiobolus odoratus]
MCVNRYTLVMLPTAGVLQSFSGMEREVLEFHLSTRASHPAVILSPAPVSTHLFISRNIHANFTRMLCDTFHPAEPGHAPDPHGSAVTSFPYTGYPRSSTTCHAFPARNEGAAGAQQIDLACRRASRRAPMFWAFLNFFHNSTPTMMNPKPGDVSLE